MRQRIWRLLSYLALAFVTSSLPQATPSAIAATRHTLDVAGQSRNYLLYTPSSLSAKKAYPLVFALHGGGGTARGLYRDTRRSFVRLAEQHKFILVYPNSIRRMWDFGAGKVSRELKARVDDRAFFSRLLDKLSETLPVDQQRIFATGISRGGQASYFLACQFPERIRAIAPITMPMPKFMQAGCKAGSGIGLALINGTEDPIVPYDGGQIVVRNRQRGAVLSTAATLDMWRVRNGCRKQPSAQTRIDAAKKDGTHVERSDWTHCRGAPVRLYRVVGGGHTWPSGSQYLPKRVVGRVTRDIDGAVEAWNFFSTFK